MNKPTSWIGSVDRLRCLYLLVSILVLMALYPYFTADTTLHRLGFTALFSAVMLFGLYSVARSRGQFWLAATLLLPAMIGNWLQFEADNRQLGIVIIGIMATFYLVMSVLVLRYVFRGRANILDRLCGALSVYFLMGLAFSEIYQVVYLIEPQSFAVSGRPLTLDSTRFLYLSFVTQTTLGYGDITPISTVTESLVILQATTGVLYVAVLVGWLVGSVRPLPDAHENDADTSPGRSRTEPD